MQHNRLLDFFTCTIMEYGQSRERLFLGNLGGVSLQILFRNSNFRPGNQLVETIWTRRLPME
jgi:hypothetical protein